MTANELQTIIDDQAKSADLRKTLLRETLSKIRFHHDFATIVKGIRRCGKSTLTHQWRKSSRDKTIALNFDDLRMLSFTTADFKVLDKVIDDLHPKTLIFDEIHDITGWELYVRQKLDQGYSVLITGSNASLLSKELGTKLTGRHVDTETHPFSYSEFLKFTKSKQGLNSLERYIQNGGFPGFLKTNDTDVLRELISDIIYKDIAVRHNIKDTRPLRDLCRFLLGNAANRINPSRLKESMHVKSATTMLEYFNYFEDSYLINRLECYSASTKSRLLTPKKLYIADTALAMAINASQTPDRGKLLENIIYQHLKREYPEIYYFDNAGAECDFIVKDTSGHWHAFQVTWALTEEDQEREFSGLSAALNFLGLTEGTIITADQSDFAVRDDAEINIVPATQFLCQ